MDHEPTPDKSIPQQEHGGGSINNRTSDRLHSGVVHDEGGAAKEEAVDRCFRKPFRRARTVEGDAYYCNERFDPENITEPVASDECA
ncbi:hypothetical protein F4819DRAFT_485882 [Hypoxylon fuscum]|nr:hypothetical protein F4819DRAFT_485882 [Hypoxylon fuscum]